MRTAKATPFLISLAGLLAAASALGQAAAVADAAREDEPLVPAKVESAGATIGQIIYDKENIFDLSKPSENKWLYRLANRWHVMTRDSVIRGQLLFREGDAFSSRIMEESERLLRDNNYLYDAKITPIRTDEEGVVDVRVWTRDLWTLTPGASVSRSGGENRTRLSLSERNLLGHGLALRLTYVDNVDRDSTSFQYFDRNLGRSWTSLFAEFADSSDGNTVDLRVIRPFYELDARWSAGATGLHDTREESFYDLGEETAEYAVDSDHYTSFLGWSDGLQQGWVRRWTMGVVYDRDRFSPVLDGELPVLLPEDRTLIYPYLGFEMLEDRYESTSNRDQIDRTEDFFLGLRLAGSLGYAAPVFGSDRESVLYNLEASRGFGSIKKKALLLSSSFSGRFDDGSVANSEWNVSASYYNQISSKRLSVTTLEATVGNNLDLDNLVDLGGDTGLRGYPLRYQSGDAKLLLTAEQRYFTDWYPFKLVRVGGAIFADVGRVWGDNPAGDPPLGWLKNIGFGLRLAPTRASGRDVIHIDLAFPLDGDPSIDEVQFLIQSKGSF